MAPVAERVEGWEDRLAALLASARALPYDLGVHDCLWLACATIEVLVGQDVWSEFAGTYTTKREALLSISRYGRSMEEATTVFLGVEPSRWQMARRGDILEFVDPTSEHHYAVCNGSRAIVYGPDGLLSVPLDSCLRCWRIG